MPKDIDDDYFYGTGTINEELENFQVYEKGGELHLHDTRTDDVVKVSEDGSLKAEKLSSTESEVTVRVPTDFDFVSGAIRKTYRALSTDLTVNIIIESGHEIAVPIHLSGNYYGHINIQSEDDVVPVSDSFDASDDVITYRQNVIGPHWAIKIDCRGNANSGVVASRNSTVTFKPKNEHGIINASEHNVHIKNSCYLFAYDCDFSGAGATGVRASRACNASIGGIDGADVSGCETGVHADRASCVRAQNLDATNSSSAGIKATNASMVSCINADVSNASTRGIVVRSSTAYATDFTATDCGSVAIFAQDGGVIRANGASISNAGSDGCVAERGGKIILTNGSVTGSTYNDLKVDLGGHFIPEGTTTSSSTGGDPHESDMSGAINSVDYSGTIFVENFETSA